ncbi:MAG: MMPL family transporter [Gammaproteobacteria bacterium]|jgi:multidrug efflux pump subunit AcrB|nr:MMPL family transporter [Gammaproteobacteria bacterium]
MITGISTWSVRHPIGVVMLTLAVMVLGGFALGSLSLDLLPRIVYPDIRVRVLDPGVPAQVMEDEVTRFLEEQLAVTEGAVAIQSETREGRSAVDLSFRYGEDIDRALRDASNRLDQARRFMPDTIEPPVIYKRDPSQRPVAEYVVSSNLRDAVELRDWVEYTLSRSLLTLPGVAAAEVGGGLQREVSVIADQYRLAGVGLDLLDLRDTLQQANRDVPAGRLMMTDGEISGRIGGRLDTAAQIVDLPLPVAGGAMNERTAAGNGTMDNAGGAPPGLLRVGDVARVTDGAAPERLRIRLNDEPGIKLSIQKQPLENTVAVVDTVDQALATLNAQGRIPPDIAVRKVDDEARYIRQSLRNAAGAALTGAGLAMLVVYLFLGSIRRTLIIGSAMPIAVLVTFILMAAFGLNLNIMTLGGLALGIGMLVDSTIVMLENIQRHQRLGESTVPAAVNAAREVTSAIVASTSTNLAAVLPFLFIGGLVGLLFRELIFTISAAILASLVVALTLVPALAGRVPATREGLFRRGIDRGIGALQSGYAWLLRRLLPLRWLVLAGFGAWLAFTVPGFFGGEQQFLPELDEGDVQISLWADEGINVERMDRMVRRVEAIVAEQPEVDAVFTTVGGWVFGRSSWENPNRAGIQVLLSPAAERDGLTSDAFIARIKRLVKAEGIPGLRTYYYTSGVRGIRYNRGDDDLSLRIKGPELERLIALADTAVERLQDVPSLSNIQHSNEDVARELSVRLDRRRAASYGLDVEDVGAVLRFALEGQTVTRLIDGDRSIDIRLRLERADVGAPGDLESIILFSNTEPRRPIRLGDIAEVDLLPQPAEIMRDRQQRVVEISASVAGDATLEGAIDDALTALDDLTLPRGYTLYEAGALETLQKGRDLGRILLALALFLVLVVMAVQYESLRNPLIILLSVPFALIGVVLGLGQTDTAVSMPVWLGLIMLAGIVVNNAIVLVEFIELRRREGAAMTDAIVGAARLRLRPILMTTLTTVFGMLPLALAFGEGSEMLQPLAIVIVWGLGFSLLVSLLLVPMIYRILGRRGDREPVAAAAEPASA